MKCDDLFRKIEQLESKYIGIWQEFCNIESPTDHKENVDAAGEYIVQIAKSFGWKIEKAPQAVSGDCIAITMNDDIDAAPIALSGHIDTVQPIGSFGTPAVRIEDDKIYGPGVVDCKGGIVAALYAMEALQSCGYRNRPVMLLLQTDEEVGSKFSQKQTIGYICEKAKNAVAFLNAEGFKGQKLTLKRKGIVRYEFTVTGKSCHSSGCYDGINPVTEAAYKIIELEKMKDKEGLTCNIGIIHGGTTANTVPEKCFFVADIRFSTAEEMERVDKIVREVAAKSYLEGTRCEVTLSSHRVAMELCERNEKLFEHISRIYRENGLPELVKGASNGGSDAAYVTAYGIPCVDSIGTQGGKIHTSNEFAYLSSLQQSAKRMASVVFSFDE